MENNNNVNNGNTSSINNDNNEKMFTQDDVNRIVGERLARVKNNPVDERTSELNKREHALYVNEQIAAKAIRRK